MLDTFKQLIQAKESMPIMQFLEEHPEVIELKDENGTSGFFHLLYSGQTEAFHKALSLKKELTFFEAIVSGMFEEVESRLSEKPQLLNQYSDDGFSPIALAAFFDQTAIAGFLLSQGADPDHQAINASKVNALHAAVAKDNEELVRLFLKNGANPDLSQTQGVTPLHSAAHRGNLEIVRLLLSHGADAALKMDNGDDAYTIAMRDGHEAVAALLK